MTATDARPGRLPGRWSPRRRRRPRWARRARLVAVAAGRGIPRDAGARPTGRLGRLGRSGRRRHGRVRRPAAGVPRGHRLRGGLCAGRASSRAAAGTHGCGGSRELICLPPVRRLLEGMLGVGIGVGALGAVAGPVAVAGAVPAGPGWAGAAAPTRSAVPAMVRANGHRRPGDAGGRVRGGAAGGRAVDDPPRRRARPRRRR